jgi:hypothetical protein
MTVGLSVAGSGVWVAVGSNTNGFSSLPLVSKRTASKHTITTIIPATATMSVFNTLSNIESPPGEWQLAIARRPSARVCHYTLSKVCRLCEESSSYEYQPTTGAQISSASISLIY